MAILWYFNEKCLLLINSRILEFSLPAVIPEILFNSASSPFFFSLVSPTSVTFGGRGYNKEMEKEKVERNP